MKTFKVVFSYTIEVEAKNPETAYKLAVSELQDSADMGYLNDVSDMAYQVEEM